LASTAADAAWLRAAQARGARVGLLAHVEHVDV
jgi:hypothetical protein